MVKAEGRAVSRFLRYNPGTRELAAPSSTTTNRQVGRVSLRILIVDDDLSMRMLLAEYFRRLGFEVEEKESAEEALEHAVSGRFDCFIFDVSMPGMSGLELLQARARPRRRDARDVLDRARRRR